MRSTRRIELTHIDSFPNAGISLASQNGVLLQNSSRVNHSAIRRGLGELFTYYLLLIFRTTCWNAQNYSEVWAKEPFTVSPPSFYLVLAQSLPVFVNILTVTVTGGWPFGVVTCILLVAIWKPVSGSAVLITKVAAADKQQGQWYRSASRQVRRLEAIIPGPINAIYGETVAGTAVIRAFGVQSIFVEGTSENVNTDTDVRADLAQTW